jgi:integrase
MAYIEERRTKKGKVRYKAQIKIKGYPILCNTFGRKTDAERWAQQTEADIRRGKHFPTQECKKHTLRDAIERYERDILPSRRRSKRGGILTWWKERYGDYTLADITSPRITEARDELLNGITRRGTKRSPTTCRHYLVTLSHVFTIAQKEWEWVTSNPVSNVSKPSPARGRIRFLNKDELHRLLEVCKTSPSPYLHTIVVIAISTGMRRSEILNLCWSNVDLKSGKIVLHETKNNERHVVHVTGYALELLRGHNKIRRLDSMLLFPGKLPSKSIDIRRAWEHAIEQAGIESFVFHDLRHTFASYMVMNGASLAETAEALNHKTLTMTKRYAHLSEEHTAGVVTRMNEKIFG